MKHNLSATKSGKKAHVFSVRYGTSLCGIPQSRLTVFDEEFDPASESVSCGRCEKSLDAWWRLGLTENDLEPMGN